MIREASRRCFAKIVGDKDDSLFETASQGAEFALKLSSGDGIESAEWLIHEQDGRIGGEGAGDTHALALAAREFMWAALAVLCRFETDEGKEEFVNASSRCARTVHFSREGTSAMFWATVK